MKPFRLLDLNPTNLEQVIRKVEPKNFGRLQQTCRRVLEFIKKSTNISIRMDGTFFIGQDSNGFWFFGRCDQHGPVLNPVIHQLPYFKISVVGMRAVRLNALYLFGCEHHWPIPPFDNLYAILQAFRIGCHDLTIENLEWTKEQCEAMFNTLKPVKVKLNSAGSNRFEALFQLNSLKIVDIRLHHCDAEIALPQLLSKTEDSVIHVENSGDKIGYIRNVFQTFYFGPFHPDLRKLYVTAECGDPMRILTEIKREFREQLGLIDRGVDHFMFDVVLPPPFPQRATLLMFTFGSNSVQLQYHCTE